MRPLLLLIPAALIGCSTVETQPTPTADLLARVSGTWAMLSEGVVDCSKDAETISFSKDQTVASFRSTTNYAVGNGKEADTITYKVLKVDGNTITMFLNGETRTTAGGDPIVWTLVLLRDNMYVWRQTDWPAGESTRPFVRCDR